MNYAKTACFYAAAGCTALDEYLETTTYKYCEKCVVGTDMTGCIYCEVKNVCKKCDVGYLLTNSKCHTTCISGGYLNKD